MDEVCRQLLAANRELSRLVFAAMMPGLTCEEVRILKRQERRARMEKRRLCSVLLVMVRAWIAAHEIPALSRNASGLARWRNTPPALFQPQRKDAPDKKLT